jgi:protein-tyrosine phosphatase
LRTELHWLDGPWPGKLAVAARPRGGDWLEDEAADWKRAGVDVVFSLLTSQEERDLDLRNEAAEFRAQGMQFASFPIPDRQVPSSEAKLAVALEKLDADLAAGRNVVVHCRQGIGRSGLIAACLLVTRGLSPGAAVGSVSASRGVSVPETTEQRNWIDGYAAAMTSTKFMKSVL